MNPGIVLVIGLTMMSAVRTELQQPPATARGGEQAAILRNDSTSPITVGYHDSTGWHEVKVDAGKDVKVTGDRMRVLTNRIDSAVITLEYPIKPASKYRVLWNSKSEMWDFAAVAE
jgi:hypothetical protein